MHIDYEVIHLLLRHPFQLARGPASQSRQTVIVRLIDGEAVGWGEATPIRYQGETIEAICGALEGFVFEDEDSSDCLDSILDRFKAQHPQCRAAMAALDFALHDLSAQRRGLPVCAHLGLNPGATLATSYTIGMAAPDVIREKVEQAAPYSILKVKLGSPEDWATLRLIRSLTDQTIRVDANEGWTAEPACEMVRSLPDFGVELVEQPVARDDLAGLARVTEASPIPVIADESCQMLADVHRLRGCVHGINIKLMKCGGIREGLRMIAAAREHGMKVMIGCMIESSIGITAAAHITPLVDYADLDGNVLITNDPFAGVTVVGGRLRLPDTAGLGVTPRL